MKCTQSKFRVKSSFIRLVCHSTERSGSFGNFPELYVLQIETAYDVLFMHSMKKRLSGEGVAQSVRFADVARRKTVKQVSSLQAHSTAFICTTHHIVHQCKNGTLDDAVSH